MYTLELLDAKEIPEKPTSFLQICTMLPIGSGETFKVVEFDRAVLKILLRSFKPCYVNFQELCSVAGVDYDDRYTLDVFDTPWRLHLITTIGSRFGADPGTLVPFVNRTFDYLTDLELDPNSLFSKKHAIDAVENMLDETCDKRRLVWIDPEAGYIFSYSITPMKKFCSMANDLRARLVNKYRDQLLKPDDDWKELSDTFKHSRFCWFERFFGDV